MGKLTRADRNCQWIERFCRVPEGRYNGQPLKVAPFMREDFIKIYDNPHGTRRAILSRGRKNAKTVEAALIALLHLIGPEASANSEIYSAAQSRDQAAILFKRASQIIRMSPDLMSVVTIRDTAKELLCPELGTFYKALSAEASTAFGLSPKVIVHDELGQVRGPRSVLYEALETAVAAQENPLSVVISTQAPTDADLLSVLIDDALAGHDPRVVVSLHTADMEADPFSDDTIRQANPALDLFMNADEVRAMAQDAKRMPSREAEYRNLILNQRVEARSPFVSRSSWADCAGDVSGDWDGLPVYAGLDLSSTKDLTALILIANVNGVWQTRPTFWLPADGLADKARVDRVPYDVWHREGFLEASPGPTIEYEYVAARLRDVFDEYDVRLIAFDRWGFKHLKPWLERAGFTEDELTRFMEFGQGFASMSPALRDLESAILQKKLAHGGHPVLTMCAANAVVQSDPAGNRKLTKDKSTGRIDGMVALAMAVSVAATEERDAGPSVYSERGALVI